MINNHENSYNEFGGFKKIIDVLGYGGAVYELSKAVKHGVRICIDRPDVNTMFPWCVTPQGHNFWGLVAGGIKPTEAKHKKYPPAQGTDMSWIKKCEFSSPETYNLFCMS